MGNETADSGFINKKHYDKVLDIFNGDLKSYLAENIVYVFQKMDSVALSNAVESLFRIKKGFSTFSRKDGLLNGASKEWKAKAAQMAGCSVGSLPEKINKTELAPDDEKCVHELFADRMQELPAGGRRDFLCFLPRTAADLSAVINSFEHFFYDKNFEFQKWCKSSLCSGVDYKDRLLYTLRKVRDSRNDLVGHYNVYKINEFTSDEAKKHLEKIAELLRLFNASIGTEEGIKLRKKLDEEIRDYVSRMEYAIPLSELESIQGYDSFTFRESRFRQDIDEANDVLYLHDRSEVEAWCRELYERQVRNSALLSASSGGNTDQTAAAEEASSHAELAGITAECPGLREYHGGFLSEMQLSEIWKNFVVIADASFWLKKATRNYLAYTVVPALRKVRRKLVVDWDTRVELFDVEKNFDGSHSLEEIQGAKEAHSAMSVMHNMGYCIYLPREGAVRSSLSGITRLVENNKNTAFAVLTTSKSFCEQLDKTNTTNVIPLNYIVNDRLTVRKSAMGVFSRFISGDSRRKMSFPSAAQKTSNINGGAAGLKNAQKLAPKSADPAPGQGNSDSAGSKKISVKLPTRQESIPKKDGFVITSSGRRLKLQRQIGEGGEGTVYGTDDPDIVAKIYRSDTLASSRYDKLKTMTDDTIKIREVCWPTELVVNESGEFVGYIMPNASGYTEFGKSVFKLQDEIFAKKEMPGWDRLSLVRLCISICKVLQAMRAKGILMGDVNPRNIMVNKLSPDSPKIMLVDCDSYQYKGFPCPVGTKIFTSPEIYKKYDNKPDFSRIIRTESDENYSVASMLFHVLMLASPPFAKRGETDVTEAWMNYSFAYRLPGDKENTGADTPDGYTRLIWNNMPKTVRENFGQVFKSKGNVGLIEWIGCLKKYENAIMAGEYTRDLKPVRYWDTKDRKFTIDFTCDGCRITGFNMPRETYEREERLKLPHLCTSCREAGEQLKRLPWEAKCSKCGKRYTSDMWMKFVLEVKNKRSFCPQCRSSFAGKR